jgi:beta-ureidopropionase
MERGQDLPVFVLDNGLRVGVMTCYDGCFPETARELSLRGAECIVWINVRGGSVEDFIIQTNMFQSHVAMVATNQAYGAGTMIGGVRAQSDVPKVSPPAVSPHLHATYFLPMTRRS